MKFLKRYYRQLLFLIIGILVGFFFNRVTLIEFETKTSWIALANFFLTISLALYLEFVVRPSFSNSRSEKDLLIDQLKDIRKEVIDIQDKYYDARKASPVELDTKAEIITKFRTLSNLIYMLRKSDEYCSITKGDTMTMGLFKSYVQYKKSLTGHGFNKNEFSFDRLHWKQHESDYQNLLTEILHSIIDINKL